MEESKHGRYRTASEDYANFWLLCSEVGIGESEQESLRFAVVCAYYAVFHGLCRICTDALTGDETEQGGSGRGWLEVHRFLGHTVAEKLAIELERDLTQRLLSTSPIDSKVLRELDSFQIMPPRAEPTS